MVLQRVKRSVLNPDCPECETTMTRVSDATDGMAEYECPECDEMFLIVDDGPLFGRPTRR